MVANCSAHKIRLLVGSEDWSRQFLSMDVGQDLRSESGLLLLSGTIEIGATAGMPGSMNPRTADGRYRWFRGQRITVEATDSSGNFVTHRFGWLYLLKVPTPPLEGKITLEVGCILNLRSFVQPDDDKSEIQYPIDGSDPPLEDRRDIVNRLLSVAGCPNCIDTIPYPIQVPISKQGGSFVELAGSLAYSAGKYLYQNNQGQIRAVSADLTPKTPLVTVQIGRDEITYQPYEGSETPSEIVKAVGTKTNLISNYGVQTSIQEEYAPAATVNPELGREIILVRRTLITETVDVRGYKRVEDVIACAGIVAPVAFPKSISLILDKYEETIKIYASSANSFPPQSQIEDLQNGEYSVSVSGGTPKGALRQIKTVVTRFFPAVAADVWEALGNTSKLFWKYQLVNSYTDTFYSYTDKELVREERIEKLEPIAAVVTDEDFDGFATSPASTIYSSINRTIYDRKTPRIGKRTTIETQVAARAFPNLDYGDAEEADRLLAKIGLVTIKNLVETSTTGQLNPPAVERQVEPFTEEEEPLECEVRFSFSPFLPTNQERERVIQVDTGIAVKEQLCKIAQIRGAELIGYALGQTLQLPLYDVFLNDGDPLPHIIVIDTDGTRSRFAVTGMQISHDPNQAVIGFTGIWLGTANAETPTVFVPPYDSVTSDAPLAIPQPNLVIIPKVGGSRSGGRVSTLPYLPQTYTYNLRGGSRSGGRLSALEGALVTSEGLPVTSAGDPVYVTG